jgi:YD repeat-containing protein
VDDDTRTHTAANGIKTRDLDSNAGTTGNNYTLVHNLRGDLIDDGMAYEFVYDAFGRLKKITDRSDVLKAEYWYNGLGHRICWKYDSDADSDVDGSDLRYSFAYDDMWRPPIVATFRDVDTSPKETYVYHRAGLAGSGGSSYIDIECAVISREVSPATSISMNCDPNARTRWTITHTVFSR